MILDLELHSEPLSKELPRRDLGQKWFMVSCDWLYKWKCFVSNKISKSTMPNSTVQNEIRTSINSRIGILPPGPISNHCLFASEAQQAWLGESKSPKSSARTYRQAIKSNLVNERDYKTVKKDVWEKFIKIYGGGPAIVRDKPYIYSNQVEDKSPIRPATTKNLSNAGGNFFSRKKSQSTLEPNSALPLMQRVPSGLDGEKKNIFGKAKGRNKLPIDPKQTELDQVSSFEQSRPKKSRLISKKNSLVDPINTKSLEEQFGAQNCEMQFTIP